MTVICALPLPKHSLHPSLFDDGQGVKDAIFTLAVALLWFTTEHN
jgi:hypothetical protein